MKLNIGITKEDRKATIQGLSELLADSYTLYLKTHNFHWNVTGPMFQTLHLMFEGQYQELALAVDGIAERIRALGGKAPGSYRAFAELTEIPDSDGVPGALDMVQILIDGHETLVRRARKAVTVAEKAGDAVSADLFIGRMQVHEKTAWMLRSLLEG